MRGNLPWWASIAALGYALKRYYAGAAPEELAWILQPTAWLVGAIFSTPFHTERHIGYVSQELSTAIVPACAGLNYAVAAFALLGAAFVGRLSAWSSKCAWLFAAAVATYGLTIAVNTSRIVAAIALRKHAPLAGISADQLHRFEGVVVYLGSLVVVYGVTSAAFEGRFESLARQLSVPAAFYLAVVLGVPFLNGGYARSSFYSHAAAVLFAVGATAGAVLGTSSVLAFTRRRAARAALASDCSSGCRRLFSAQAPRARGSLRIR